MKICSRFRLLACTVLQRRRTPRLPQEMDQGELRLLFQISPPPSPVGGRETAPEQESSNHFRSLRVYP